MNHVRAVLRDRKRAQRGSVLSGVLIIVAFIGIISGALMTELSTNFLLSRNLATRAANEATVSSAVELALDAMQNAPLANGCPTLTPISINGRTAAASYVNCAPVVDQGSLQYTAITPSSSFNVDGSHSVLSTISQDLYMVGDSSGNVYQYGFGSSGQNWSTQLGGRVSGPPTAILDVSTIPNDIANLVPLDSSGSEGGPGCASRYCVEFIGQDVGRAPDRFCAMAANGPVTSRPASGINFPAVAFFGDRSGTFFGYAATESGGCALRASLTPTGGLPLVAGPIAFPGPSQTDQLYMIASNGAESRLVHYEYSAVTMPPFEVEQTLPIPIANAVGIAVDGSALPARLAITFAGGQVAVVRIAVDFTMTLLAPGSVPSTIGGSPYWCHCPGPTDLIGVGASNGALYLLDANLNLQATYQGSSAINTAPGSDSIGEWFFGADDGNLYEVQQVPGQPTMTLVKTYGRGNLGRVGSSAQVGGCPAGICVYLGALNGKAYIVPLDARDADLTACIATSPPACSGDNPRLWARVEVGVAGNPQAVHVTGWSYFSPPSSS